MHNPFSKEGNQVIISLSVLFYSCELPSLSIGDMCPHPDLPLAMAEGTNVVTDTSDPLFTLDYMVESSLKFNLLLAGMVRTTY